MTCLKYIPTAVVLPVENLEQNYTLVVGVVAAEVVVVVRVVAVVTTDVIVILMIATLVYLLR